MTLRLLFVEDDPAGRELGAFNLTRAGYEVDAVASGEAAIEVFSPERHSLVITDLRLPGVSGLEVLRRVKARSPGTAVIVVTAYGSIDAAVDAVKQGATDFIGKPFHREHLLLAVERALNERRLAKELDELRALKAGIERPIVAASRGMEELVSLVDRVALSDSTVLVLGETGTGKELVARRLHQRGRRSRGPFVAINCASLPETLLESELFGHEKGAFTGADRPRTGRFRQAEGGTLFLDEIGELPLALQGKLLRAIEERVVDVLGRDTPVPVNVRVVAATHRELHALSEAGKFRADLLYRLDVVSVRVPPLRERREEIPALVRHFVERLAPGRELIIPDALVSELVARDWPGNVRQLENTCERLVILCPGDELRREDLPAPPPETLADASRPAEPSDWPALPPEGLGLVDLEKRVIERVLELKRGNVSQSAAYLRVPRHILVYRMEKYGIARP